MERVHCKIKGISPLLMHHYPMVPVEALEKLSPEKQAEHAAYRTTDGQLYVPSVAIGRSFINGAAFSKGKGRATLSKPLAACMRIFPTELILDPQKYTIDARPVVIRATQGRIMRYRPCFNEWTIEFDIEFDPVLVNETQMRKVVDDAGNRVGVLDFRPERKGPFGRYVVTVWDYFMEETTI